MKIDFSELEELLKIVIEKEGSTDIEGHYSIEKQDDETYFVRSKYLRFYPYR